LLILSLAAMAARLLAAGVEFDELLTRLLVELAAELRLLLLG
jgi:hypothetical protein